VIFAGMATIKGREGSLRLTVNSIIDQIDMLYLHFNNYTPPEWYKTHPKIIVIAGSDEGDMGKFSRIDQADSIYLSIDDDLTYPPDYVSTIVEALERYKGCIVSFHGSVMVEGWESYYRDRLGIQCLAEFQYDIAAHCLGTGVSALNRQDVPLSWDDLRGLPRDMSDVHVSRWAHKNGVPLIALAHREGWITHNKIDMEETIWHRVNIRDKDDSVQSSIVREMEPFRYYAPMPIVETRCIECGEPECHCLVGA